MHYQFIMQSLCIFSFFWWKLAGIGEYDRALSWKGNAGSQVRKTQQLSAPLWTNEWESKGKPLSLSSRVFMTPEHTVTNPKMHLGWSFLWFFFSPQETKIPDFVGILSCSVCVPQKHCNQYYQMYFKTRMWLSKIAQLKLMKEHWSSKESSRNIKCISKLGVDKDLYLPLFYPIWALSF